MKQVLLAVVTAVLVFSATSASADIVQSYHNPTILGLWVDRCEVKFGNVDCSNAAFWDAANQFCRNQGAVNADKAWAFAESGRHSTRRFTYTVENGRVVSNFQVCQGCSEHFTQIDCRFNIN